MLLIKGLFKSIYVVLLRSIVGVSPFMRGFNDIRIVFPRYSFALFAIRLLYSLFICFHR